MLDVLLGAVSGLVLVDEEHLSVHGLLHVLQVTLPFPPFLVINHIKRHGFVLLLRICGHKGGRVLSLLKLIYLHYLFSILGLEVSQMVGLDIHIHGND